MKTQKMVRICSGLCAGALLVTMLSTAAFAADPIDVGTVRPGDEITIPAKDPANGTVTVRVSGNTLREERAAQPGTASSKPYADTVYDWDNIPEDWIIPLRQGGSLVGYCVVIPGNSTASFRVSGSDFSTVQKKLENTYGEPIALEKGKTRTLSHVTAIKVML